MKSLLRHKQHEGDSTDPGSAATHTMSPLNKPKSEVTPEELQWEEEEFNMCPLSVLTQSGKKNTQVLISCHNN